jgi:hypothetical protein
MWFFAPTNVRKVLDYTASISSKQSLREPPASHVFLFCNCNKYYTSYGHWEKMMTNFWNVTYIVCNLVGAHQFTFCCPFLQCRSALDYCTVGESISNDLILRTVFYKCYISFHGAWGSVGYKQEGRGFEIPWGEILNLPNPSGRT